MKKLMILAIAFSIAAWAGCAKRSEKDIAWIDSLEKQIQEYRDNAGTKEAEIAAIEEEKAQLENEKSKLEGEKNLAKYVFVGTPIVNISVDRVAFTVNVKGAIKNTGTVDMKNLTLKVLFLDNLGSELVRKFAENKRVPEVQMLSEKHVYYMPLADVIHPDDTRDFEMKIYFKNLEGSLDQVKKAIDAWDDDGSRIKVAVLWGDYRDKE